MRGLKKIPICFVIVMLIVQMPFFSMASEYSNEVSTELNTVIKLNIGETTIDPSGDEINFQVSIKPEKEMSYGYCLIFLYLKDGEGKTVDAGEYIDIDRCSYSDAFYSSNCDVVAVNMDGAAAMQVTPAECEKVAASDTYINWITFNVKTKALSEKDNSFSIEPVFTLADSEETLGYAEFSSVNINVGTATPDPEPTETTYEISAKPSAESVNVGNSFTVDVVASADQDVEIAAVNAVIKYDSTLVKPVAAVSKALSNGIPADGKKDPSVTYHGDESGVDNPDGQGTIFLFGNKEKTGEDGLVVATYTFEALKSGNAEFSITEGATIGKSGETADFAAKSGAPAAVEIAEIPDKKIIISGDTYNGAPEGENVLKYIAKAMPAEGNAYFYGDNAEPLYYAGETAEGEYLFLGFVKESSTAALKEVSEKASSYVKLSDSGDLNDSGSVNAIDSLIAYELSNGIYKSDTDMSKLSAKARLEADINRDDTVDSKDARAIMYKALNIQDPGASQTEA